MSNARVRIQALDGIRGFAIFLVIINHLTYNISSYQLPRSVELVWNSFVLSGPLGVNIFFILCGFLMTLLYPTVKNPLNFIKKRYLRIFPLFFTICTFNMMSFIWKDSQILLQIAILLILTLSINHRWRQHLLNDSYKTMVGKIVEAFLLLQICMVVINIVIGRLNQTQFNQLPGIAKYSIVYLGNLTLTLWAGWNIPILSGPYWSLAPEVLFYILYPLAIVSILPRFKNSHWVQIIVLVISSLVGIFLLNIVFNNILALSRLNMVRTSAFVMGITAALLFKDAKKWTVLTSLLRHPWIQILTILIIPSAMYLSQFYSDKNQTEWGIFHTVLNISLLFVFSSTLVEGTFMNRFFGNKILLFLGLVSYPAYLVHSAVIQWLGGTFSTATFYSTCVYTVAALITTVLVAYILHILVEKPYFEYSEQHNFPVK